MESAGYGCPPLPSSSQLESSQTASQDRKRPLLQRLFGNRIRFLVLTLAVVCLTLNMANSYALYFSVICMEQPPQHHINHSANATLPPNATRTEEKIREHNNFQKKNMFTDREQNWLFSIPSIGFLLGSLPFGQLVRRYGFRNIFLLYSSVCALTTAIVPPFAFLGFYPLLGLLLLQGCTFGIMFVSMDSISKSWSPKTECGFFLAVISSCIQLGRVITPPVGAFFCESPMGWPWLFYSLGAVSLLSTILFHLVYRDSPRQLECVSPAEVGIIEEGKTSSETEGIDGKNERRPTPYLKMFSDLAVLSILVCFFGGSLGNQIFVQYGPVFLHNALGYSILGTGFAAAMPFLLAVGLKIGCAALTDRLTFLTDRMRVVLYIGVSQYVMALCYVGLALLPSDRFTLLLQLFFSGVIMFAGLFNIGIVKNTQIIAGPFSAIVTAATSVMVGAVRILTPFFVTMLAPDSHQIELWKRVFVATAFIQAATAMLFLFGSGSKLRDWADLKNNNRATNKIEPIETRK